MKQWFFGRFEDPAENTSHMTSEGGYLWNHGGPYDADDELQNEFHDLAALEIVQEAVEEVQSTGIYEWAAVRTSDYDDNDYDRDLRLREGADDDGIYPIDEPLPDISEETAQENGNQFPDLPPGQAYLTAENGSRLTDEQGRGLIVDVPSSPNSAQPNGGDSDALRNEMLDRLNILESLIRQQMEVAPNRGHNNPPELLQIERPVSQEQLAEVTTAIAEIRKESESASPNRENVEAYVSMFRRLARLVGMGTIWLTGAAATGIIGQEAGLAYAEHKQHLYEALVRASDAVTAWLHSLPLPF
jgi:hypothetical protein